MKLSPAMMVVAFLLGLLTLLGILVPVVVKFAWLTWELSNHPVIG